MTKQMRWAAGLVIIAIGAGCSSCAGVLVPPAQAAGPGQAISLLRIAQAALDCPEGQIAWSVVEPGAGVIDPSGVYTAAPCSSFTAGTYHISASGCGRSVQIPITLSDPATAITILCGRVAPATCCTPPPIAVRPGSTVQFYARVDYACPNHVTFEPSAPPTTCK